MKSKLHDWFKSSVILLTNMCVLRNKNLVEGHLLQKLLQKFLDIETIFLKSFLKSNKSKVGPEFEIFSQKGNKISPRENSLIYICFVFANKPSGGVSRDRVCGCWR